ncbi:MAG: arsenosugar biosynthesis radical SAM (seleno)protein ArsS [Oligoflexales bacterium]
MLEQGTQGRWESFAKKIRNEGVDLRRTPLTMLQINVGKLCNQTCLHCHVDAGPNKKKENMDQRTAQRLVLLGAECTSLTTIDLTGGAPELNPHFRYLVESFRKMGKQVIDRCNLTVFFEPGQEGTPQFLKDNGVKVVASLPCYSKENVEQQRGDGVFGKSIEALKILNELGYGFEGSGLELDLVYNPIGPFLPPSQVKLKSDYRTRLWDDFGIRFNELYTITNMPIKRFLFDLKKSEKYDPYMQLLYNNFNKVACERVMCRSLLSISWDGKVYDCDFNQMLDMPVASGKTIWDTGSLLELAQSDIKLADHCYGCTAGAGSSCGGALT